MSVSTIKQSSAHIQDRPWAAIVCCLALAFIFLGIAGFAPVEVVHNTAHDSRHSLAFPCH